VRQGAACELLLGLDLNGVTRVKDGEGRLQLNQLLVADKSAPD
jgi:hypothetical protein